MAAEKFVRPTDLARQLNVKVETVTAWIRRGDLPAINVGTNRPQYRIAPDHLAAFLERRAVAPEIITGAKTARRKLPEIEHFFR